ncbi:MAG TPA: hypothetical protein VH253_11745 [Phycisphaerae bacterium]|nr:hypothetical protein [Phycisphaerae bacterium]
MPRLERRFLGDCGEHYVASYLYGMGLVPKLTERNTVAVDMTVATATGQRSISLQVKTGQHRDTHVTRAKKPENDYWVWRVGRKAVTNRAKASHWYAFVAVGNWLTGGGSPEVFFVPSHFVVKRLRENKQIGRPPFGQSEWFHMTEEEARLHRGLIGYRKLEKALKDKGAA